MKITPTIYIPPSHKNGGIVPPWLQNPTDQPRVMEAPKK